MKSSKNNKNNSIVLHWIYKIAKKQMWLVVLLSVISAVSGLLGVALALTSKQVLDIATKHTEGNFTVCAFILFGIIALQILLNAVAMVFRTLCNGRLTMAFRNHLFKCVTAKKYSKLSCYHSGDLLNRFTSDSEVVVSALVTIIPSVFSMLARIIGAVTALVALDSRATAIIFFVGLLVPAIGRIVNRKYKQIHKDCQQSEGKTRSFLQECFENSVVIKTFVSEQPFIKKLNQLMIKNYKFKIKRSYISVLTHLLLHAMFTIGYYLVMLWGASMISLGTMTYGTLMAFLQLFNQLSGPLQNISGILPQYYSAIASAERLMELENGENDLKPISEDKLNAIQSEFKTLCVDNVTFSYDNEDILKHCSFTASRGEITAITGESGSGKSTIFKLLLGLYEPQSGEITVDGKIKLDTSLRGLFAYVPQGNLLLSGTIRDNITLCDSSISEESIIKATKTAEIYDIIVSLPDGFDTMLAERGGGLSEGQIQRISLARALLTDAPILLLDEATSALDEATESRVLSNIKNFNDKTIIFVTHRNTSLRVCDKILYVEDKQFTVLKDSGK